MTLLGLLSFQQPPMLPRRPPSRRPSSSLPPRRPEATCRNALCVDANDLWVQSVHDLNEMAFVAPNSWAMLRWEMRLTDNLHPSIGTWHPSSALHCDVSHPYTRKNLQRTSQCETNDTVLEQKWLGQEASTTFLLPLPPNQTSGPSKVFPRRFRIADLPQGPVAHLVSFRSPVSTALSFILAAIRFLRLSLILYHSLLAWSLLRLRLSSSPSQLQKSFFALLSSAPGLSVQRPPATQQLSAAPAQQLCAVENAINEELHKQLYSHST